MAITPTLVDSDTGNTLTNTITGTIDVSGSNRLAIVLICQRGTQTVSSITYGSDSLEELGSIYNSDDGAVHIWYLKQPTTGTGITVTITFSAAMTESASAWMGSFSGVDQTTPLGTYYSAIEDGSDPHNFTVTAVTNDYILANVAAEYGSPITITSGNQATMLWTYDAGSFHSAFARYTSTAGNFEFSFDLGTGTHSAYNGVAIKGLDVTYSLTGITKNNAGSVLGTCECFLVKDNLDDTYSFVAYQQSNGSGVYNFTGVADNDAQYQVIAWKDNTPHVFDVTDHVLQPEVV